MEKIIEKHWFGLGLVMVLVLGVFLRTYRIGSFPDGMHFDEAWFGYNAWLLSETGKNIYGEKLPISVDMFGDHVSAMQAYLTIPLVKLLGLRVESIRLTVVVFGILTGMAGCELMWLMTKNKKLVVLAGGLIAVSPWQIIMSRASSTVVIDGFMLTAFLVVYWMYVKKVVEGGRIRWWGMGAYVLAVLAYFTYFTSRLLVIPMGVLLAWLVLVEGKTTRRKVMMAVAPLLLYLVFPFGVMMPTPYALGRFSETKIVNHVSVKEGLKSQYIRSTQGGAPVWLMRVMHNKVTENVRVLWHQYATFLSPDTMMFMSPHPPRYEVPNVGVVTPVEMVGLWACLFFVVWGWRVKDKKRARVALVLGMWTLGALVVSALTVDDFPNMQRAVIATPFWQMAAAMGVFQIIRVLPETVGRWRVKSGGWLVMGGIISAGLFWFWYNYTVQAPYYEPYYRNVVGAQVARWINANAHDAKILGEEQDGYFLLSLFFAKENIFNLPVEKESKYFLIEGDEFKIGTRDYVRQLCGNRKIVDEDYDYLILWVKEGCPVPWWMKGVSEFRYKNDVSGMVVLSPDRQIQEEYRVKLGGVIDESKERTILDEAWSKEPPVMN